MPKLAFSLVVALMETHTQAQTRLSLVYALPHYTLVPHYCVSFPDCSHSYDQTNSTLEDTVLLCSLFCFCWPFAFLC